MRRPLSPGLDNPCDPMMVGVQRLRARCSAPVTWHLLVGPGIKAALTSQVSTSPRSWLSPSQLLSDPRQLPSLVLDPLKPVAGGFWGRVFAGHFFFLLLFWLLQQLFGFCPLLGGGRRVWLNSLHPPSPKTLPGSSSPCPSPVSLPKLRTPGETAFLLLLLLTCSLCSGAHVCQSAKAQRRPRVTAHTPWGVSPPELKATRRPQRGRT